MEYTLYHFRLGHQATVENMPKGCVKGNNTGEFTYKDSLESIVKQGFGIQTYGNLHGKSVSLFVSKDGFKQK